MQQFTVPQFIDVEDKIFGPITTRQFIELIVGALLLFIFYRIFDFTLFVITGLLDFAITGIIAFVKINGVSFHYFILNILQTWRRPGLRVWNKALTTTEVRDIMKRMEPKKEEKVEIPVKDPLTSSSLSEISLIVDTGGQYEGEQILQKKEADKLLNKKVK